MSIPNLETRCADLGPVELRESPSGGRVLAGYAAVFNRYSQNLGGFVEQVDPADGLDLLLGHGLGLRIQGGHDLQPAALEVVQAVVRGLAELAPRAALAQLSPMGKMPVLVAGDRALAESSVIIEWLAIHHPAAPRPRPRRPRGRAGCANVGPDRRPAPGRAAAG